MSRIKLGDIWYLALEGGGGKGAAYLGALKLLSDNSLKGNDPPLLPLNAKSRLKGLSGASAGAIVTYMLAIGMTVDEIEKETNSSVDYDPAAAQPIKPGGKTPVFNIFFEAPQPGVVKSIYYDQNRNVSGYAVDKLTVIRSRDVPGKVGAAKKIFPLIVSEAQSGRFLKDYKAAVAAGRANQRVYAAAYPITSLVLEYAQTLSVKQLDALDDGGLEGLIKQKRWWADCAHCVLYDRGLLSGKAVREYMRYLTRTYLKPSRFAGRTFAHGFTDESIAEGDPSTLTFTDLHLITGCKLWLMGTNITNKLSLPFSIDATPDFPVIDAVGLSMSIPGLFKPTFVAGEVMLQGNPDELAGHNYKYKGFFVDGGMLANIPIHAFDYEPDNPTRGVQHPRAFGLGLADGVDRNENPGFQADKLYQDYRKAELAKAKKKKTPDEVEDDRRAQLKLDAAINSYLKLSPRVRNLLPNMSATREPRSFDLRPGGYTYTHRPLKRLFAPFSMLLDLLFRQVLGTLTDYTPEAGQFRTPEERERYVPLDAYDISLVMFAPDANLSRFVNIRSFNKLYWYFFNRAPELKLLQGHFQGYTPTPGVRLPQYLGIKSPTND